MLAAEAAYGPADLELTTTDRDGYKGFNGGLKVYIGRNCVNNPTKEGFLPIRPDYKLQLVNYTNCDFLSKFGFESKKGLYL